MRSRRGDLERLLELKKRLLKLLLVTDELELGILECNGAIAAKGGDKKQS